MNVEDLWIALLAKEKTSWQISLAMTVDGQALLSPQEQWIRKKDVEAFLVELRKQLSEEIEHAHEKAEYWKDKDELRQIWVAIELSYKQLLEASDSLSPKEVKDVAIARKELASGKCKTFKTADEMIADLHENEYLAENHT
jgi:hypothetical protein